MEIHGVKKPDGKKKNYSSARTGSTPMLHREHLDVRYVTLQTRLQCHIPHGSAHLDVAVEFSPSYTLSQGKRKRMRLKHLGCWRTVLWLFSEGQIVHILGVIQPWLLPDYFSS